MKKVRAAKITLALVGGIAGVLAEGIVLLCQHASWEGMGASGVEFAGALSFSGGAVGGVFGGELIGLIARLWQEDRCRQQLAGAFITGALAGPACVTAIGYLFFTGLTQC